METYYIYHIPGIKIGCSKTPEFRVRRQGYTEYQILETHNDITIAGKREIELQIQFGYKVDNIPYHKCDYSTMGQNRKTKIIATHLESGIQKEFDSLTECSHAIGVGIGRITHILSPKYKRKSTYGYTFNYK